MDGRSPVVSPDPAILAGNVSAVFPSVISSLFSLFHGKYRLKCLLGLYTNLGTLLQTGGKRSPQLC